MVIDGLVTPWEEKQMAYRSTKCQKARYIRDGVGFIMGGNTVIIRRVYLGY